MRGSGNYYDTDPRQDNGVIKGGWAPNTPAVPFGPAEAAPIPTPAGSSAPARRAAGRRRGMLRFCLLVTLMLVLTGAAVYVQDGLPNAPYSVIPWSQPLPGEDWPALLDDTTAPRAPVGSGVTLTLSPQPQQALSPEEIYQKVSPAVVGVRSAVGGGAALGTGIIMSPHGYLITNAHIIAGAHSLTVTLPDTEQCDALLVGYDAKTDLAVLKIDAQDLPAADFGDSALLRVGEAAYAIGNPLGEALRGTMTDGIISAIDRSVAVDGGQMTLLQTTAALNSGNSGGALVNAGGQVVGVTNMKMMSTWETIEGLGFAIPTATVKEVADEIIAQGFYAGRLMLGVTVQAIPAQNNAPAGLYVVSVRGGSDAQRKGVAAGDIITAVNGQSVTAIEELEAAKAALGEGESLTLELWNAGLFRRLEVSLTPEREME